MKNEKRNFILLQIIDKIQEEYPDPRDSINKSAADIYRGKNTYFVFYIFDAVFTNKSTFS